MERRTKGEGGVYWNAAKGRFIGSISLGTVDGKRKKKVVSGKTRPEVSKRIRQVQDELAAGVRSSGTYRVSDCLDDWLGTLTGKPQATQDSYRFAAKHVRAHVGSKLLTALTARDVRAMLADLAPGMSARSLRLVLQILERAIRHAQVDDLVARNVASLVRASDIGGTRAGRPSHSLTLPEAVALLDAAARSGLNAYCVLSLICGARTEEMRAAKWTDVNLNGDVPTISLVRSVRSGGGMKTVASTRRLELPPFVVAVLRAHYLEQARQRVAAGGLWRDNDLVFCNLLGGPLDSHNVRRSLTRIMADAGIPRATPRELRHSFVSILSADGMGIEAISHLVGHSSPAVTSTVYRHDIAVQSGHVEPMGRLFGGGC